MDYEELRKYQRMERNSTKLAELGKDFYYDLQALIKEHREKYEKSKSIEDMKILENILKISRDIFERREQKIIMKTLRCVRTKEMEEDNIVEHEKEMFGSLCDILKDNRRGFEQLLIGETREREKKMQVEEAKQVLEEKVEKISGPETTEKIKEKERLKLDTILVRIVKKVPKFVSSDLKEHGPFEVNEIKKLPEKEALLLSKRKFVEVI